MLNFVEQFILLSPSTAGILTIVITIGGFGGAIYIILSIGDLYHLIRNLKRR